MTLRHRDRTFTDDHIPVHTLYSYTGSVYRSHTQPPASGSEDFDDHVEEGFHRRIRAGEIINNPCDYNSSTFRYSDNHSLLEWIRNSDGKLMYYTDVDDGNATHWFLTYRVKPYLWDSCSAVPGNITEALQEAKSKCLANVDSTPYEFFEDLLEIRETIRFLRNPLESIRQVCKAYKLAKAKILRQSKLNRWDAKRTAKSLASCWNQYRFALMPLVRSVLTAIEVYENRDKIHRNKRRTAHGKVSTADETTETMGGVWGSGGSSIRVTYDKDSAATYAYHAQILYEVSNPLEDLKFALGLRLKDIPYVMWQVFPLSFMLDRLVNVSDFVQGIVNLSDPTVTFLSASVTKRITKSVDVRLRSVVYPYGYYTINIDEPDRVLLDTHQHKRDQWQPALIDTVPPVHWKGLIEDATKVLDLLAISISMIK